MTRAERRHRDFVKALRKQRIALDLYEHDWYTSLHAYSKNKIHCSCPMCASKTNNKQLKIYDPTLLEKKQDIIFNEEMSELLKDLKDSD